MPRRKTIYVEPMPLLSRIVELTDEYLADFKRGAARTLKEYDAARKRDAGYQETSALFEEHCDLERAAKAIRADGLHYNVDQFLGHAATSTERVYTQRALRELHSLGYVRLNGMRATKVKVLPAGRRVLNRKPEPANVDTNLSASQPEAST